MTLRKQYAGFKGSGGFGFNPFTPDELEAIHQSTMEVMGETGIYVQKKEAQQLFKQAGARVYDDGLVKIPAHIVEEAIRLAPSSMVAHGRHPSKDIVLGGSRVSFTNFGEGIKIADPYTGEIRSTTKADLAMVCRVIDSLDIIGVLERPVGSLDKPGPVQALHNFEAILNNSSKHCLCGPSSGRNVEVMLEMAEEAVGGSDALAAGSPISFATCPVSPLRLPNDICEIIMASAKYTSTAVLTMGMSGGSSPVHLAGTLVVANAELLAALTLVQLVKPGAPFIYGSSTGPMYLKTAAFSAGAPELAMANAGLSSLAKYYGLPSWMSGG